MDRFKIVVSCVAVANAEVAAIQNSLWYESRFRDDLMLNTLATLEDAMHRATRYIEVEEERLAMAKKHAPPKVSISKDKPRDDHYEPRPHYDKDYQKRDQGKKAANYYVGNAQPHRSWNKNYRTDDTKDS